MCPGDREAILETERLLLRVPRPDDVDALLGLYGDPEVTRYLTGETGTREGVLAGIRAWRERWRSDGFSQFAAIRREDGKVLGCIGLLAWDPATWENGSLGELGPDVELELGWKLARAFWGHGYATEGAVAVRDWALRELAPPRLISLIHPDNTRSQRVAAKVGERYERDVVTGTGRPAQLWTT